MQKLNRFMIFFAAIMADSLGMYWCNHGRIDDGCSLLMMGSILGIWFGTTIPQLNPDAKPHKCSGDCGHECDGSC